MRGARSLALVVASAMVTTACGGATSRREGAAGLPETSRVGSGVERPGRRDLGSGPTGGAGSDPGSGSATAATDGVAVIDVRDPRGPGRSGVPLVVEGPVTRRFVSGAGGRTEVKAPPGNYRVRIETGCTTDIEVVRGASGRLDLALGDVATGDLTVDARQRYRPTYGAYWREGEKRGTGRAHWRPGEVHVVEVAMADACAGPASDLGAEGSPLGRLKFVPGDGLELVSPSPAVLGPAGRARVRLRCTGPEVDVALVWVDAEVPDDAIAIFGGDVLEDQATPFCTSP